MAFKSNTFRVKRNKGKASAGRRVTIMGTGAALPAGVEVVRTSAKAGDKAVADRGRTTDAPSLKERHQRAMEKVVEEAKALADDRRHALDKITDDSLRQSAAR